MNKEPKPKFPLQEIELQIARDMRVAFRMANISVSASEAWLLYQISMKYSELGGKLDVDEVCRLMANQSIFFPEAK